jgi:hypothetical protein
MAVPGDQGAADAAARGYLRVSHADRDHVISALKVAFVQGRLTKGEFDLRVGRALASRTYAELAALAADLPAGLTTGQPTRTPAPERARKPEKAAKVTAFMGFAVALLLVGVSLGPGDVPERLIGLAVLSSPSAVCRWAAS